MAKGTHPHFHNIDIGVYQASLFPELCEKYLESHQQVLSNIGVTGVSSSAPTWMERDDCYLILAFIDDKMVGGARLQKHSIDLPMPIIKALEDYPMLADYVNTKSFDVAEICGLWNSRKMSVIGLGSKYMTRVAVALSLGVDCNGLFAFCANYTKKTAENVGFRVCPWFNSGVGIPYPTDDMLAFVMELPDLRNLSFARNVDKREIFTLRSGQQLVSRETHRNLHFFIRYSAVHRNEWRTQKFDSAKV